MSVLQQPKLGNTTVRRFARHGGDSFRVEGPRTHPCNTKSHAGKFPTVRLSAVHAALFGSLNTAIAEAMALDADPLSIIRLMEGHKVNWIKEGEETAAQAASTIIGLVIEAIEKPSSRNALVRTLADKNESELVYSQDGGFVTMFDADGAQVS